LASCTTAPESKSTQEVPRAALQYRHSSRMHEISPHDLNRLTCIRCAMSLPTRHDSASSKSAAHQHSAGPGMMMLGMSASMIGHGVCTCIHVSGTVGHAPLTRHTRHRSCHTFWQLHQPRRRPPARNSLPEDKRYRLSRWPDLHCALNRTESDRTQISGANIPLCGGQTALRGNGLHGCVPTDMSKVIRRHPGNSGRLVPRFLDFTTIWLSNGHYSSQPRRQSRKTVGRCS